MEIKLPENLKKKVLYEMHLAHSKVYKCLSFSLPSLNYNFVLL